MPAFSMQFYDGKPPLLELWHLPIFGRHWLAKRLVLRPNKRLLRNRIIVHSGSCSGEPRQFPAVMSSGIFKLTNRDSEDITIPDPRAKVLLFPNGP